MRFSSPGWLPAGLLAAVAIIWLWRLYDARQDAALAKFVATHLRRKLTRSISPGKRNAQAGQRFPRRQVNQHREQKRASQAQGQAGTAGVQAHGRQVGVSVRLQVKEE